MDVPLRKEPKETTAAEVWRRLPDQITKGHEARSPVFSAPEYSVRAHHERGGGSKFECGFFHIRPNCKIRVGFSADRRPQPGVEGFLEKALCRSARPCKGKNSFGLRAAKFRRKFAKLFARNGKRRAERTGHIP